MSQLLNNTTSLQEILETINNLPDAGDVELPELSNPANASDALAGKEFIDQDGNKVTGTIETKTSSNLTASGATVTVPAGYYAANATKSVATATQATPSVSIDTNGKITATAIQTAGYVSAGTKTGTKQLTTQIAKTITPSKSSQTAVAKNVYTTGAVTVAAIPSQYITTTDATAAASEIFSGETAYVNGSKVTGTFTIDSELTTQNNLITQIQSVVDGLPEAGGIELPALSNPATSDEILDGYEAIDEDGNVITGTHVCKGGGGFENGSFTIYNSTADLYFAVNGVACVPGETTIVPISELGLQSFFLMNFDGWTIEDMHFLYEYEGDDGEMISDGCGVVLPDQDGSGYFLCGYSEISNDCTFTAIYS